MTKRINAGTAIRTSALCAALALFAGNAAAFDAWPEDALVKALHDFTKPAKPADKIYVAMARGETEAGQAAFRGTVAAEVSASVSPLRSDSGAAIESVKAQFLNYHSIARAQWPAGAVTEFIKHPDEFPIIAPDAFRTEATVPIEPNQTRAVWIIIETKPDTPAGIYRGAVTLTAGTEKAEIPLEVRVHEAIVPAKRSLKIYNWLFWNGGTGWGWLRNNLGSPHWGESDWAFIEQVADNMVAHRQNMFTVPVIHNVLCGPNVHSVKTIWKKAGDYNINATIKTLEAIVEKGGENVMSQGRDGLSEWDIGACLAALRGMGNELEEEDSDEAEEIMETLGNSIAELDKIRSDAKHKADVGTIAKMAEFARRRQILGHGVMGKRDPKNKEDKNDTRNVFERECEFDFSLFDRASDIFLKRDPQGIIAGGWLGLFGGCGAEIIPGSGDHYLRLPAVPIFNSAGKEVDMVPSMDSNDERYLAFLKALLPALVKHLKEKGRLDNFIIGLCDETFPMFGKARVLLADEIRKFAPEIKYNDANRDTERNVGSVDLWYPLPSHLECHIEFYRARQKASEEVGYYTCVTPGGYNMNRFVDFPLVKTRLLHWHNFRFGTTGFLHWGYNPWIPVAYTNTVRDNGDFNVIYRDDEWNLVSSIRQAAQRDGIEDYELLKVVEAKDPEVAEKICAAIVTDCREYTRDVPRFREVRELLLAAAGPGDIDAELKKKIMDLKPDHFTLLKDMPKDSEIDDAGWELVYKCDKFKPEDMGTDWIVTSGEWAVEDGALCKTNRSDGNIFFAKAVGPNQKLEFTAWSDLPYPNDLSGLLCGELTKETKTVKGEDTEVWTGSYGSAFFFGFGGEGNAFSKFMVRGVEMRVMPKTVTPGKKHHIVCRREGKRVTHIIDGEVLLDAESMDTLDGEGNAHPGFYFFDKGAISSVKIFTKK